MISYLLILVFVLICVFYHPINDKDIFNYNSYIEKFREKHNNIKLAEKHLRPEQERIEEKDNFI